MGWRMESLLNAKAISLKAFIDTSLTLGTEEDVTLKIDPKHLSTYLSPNGLNAISLIEYKAAILK